ncbi:MAG: hypothetical protein J3R72DRAFT_438625 [Linnemannia gamsii]|nr:MAG: hypothetical protein J3R72DRAFT_438605 [Linnemannia gamsii]KAK3844344.1 MAG: hypothetical protein J3R72DRAFT_438625 [Linnemannia gamsii]
MLKGDRIATSSLFCAHSYSHHNNEGNSCFYLFSLLLLLSFFHSTTSTTMITGQHHPHTSTTDKKVCSSRFRRPSTRISHILQLLQYQSAHQLQYQQHQDSDIERHNLYYIRIEYYYAMVASHIGSQCSNRYQQAVPAPHSNPSRSSLGQHAL